MAEEIGTLVARVVADNEQFRADMVKMSRTLESNTARMNTALAKVNSSFGGLGTIIRRINPVLAAFGVSLSAVGLVRIGRDAIAAGDAIENAARSANIGAESLQRYRFAFSQLSDLTKGEVDEALTQFNRRLGDAFQGTGEAAAALRALNVQLRDGSGQFRSTEAVLSDALSGLAGVQNEAIRSARAVDLFGRSAGASLAASLDQGVGAMEALRDATPGVISNENVKLAAELNDEFSEMADTIGGKIKNAFIEATARAGDFFGVIELSKHAELLLQIRDLEREIARFNPGGGQFGSFNRPLAEIQAELDETRRQLQIERARDAGVGGFATSSFLNGRPDGGIAPGVPFDELPGIVAELEELARQRASSEALVVTELEKQKKLAIEMLDAQQSLATEEQERLLAIQNKRKEDEETLAAEIKAKALAKTEETVTEMERSWISFGQSVGRTFEDTLADAFLGIETDFKDMLKRLAAQAASSAILRQFASVSSGGTAKFFNFLGFGGALATGGPVSPGNAYLVGEHGPELFAPRSTGYVFPNDSGGVNLHSEMYVNVSGNADRETLAQMGRMLDDRDRRILGQIRDTRRRGRL